MFFVKVTRTGSANRLKIIVQNFLPVKFLGKDFSVLAMVYAYGVTLRSAKEKCLWVYFQLAVCNCSFASQIEDAILQIWHWHVISASLTYKYPRTANTFYVAKNAIITLIRPHVVFDNLYDLLRYRSYLLDAHILRSRGNFQKINNTLLSTLGLHSRVLKESQNYKSLGQPCYACVGQ